MMNVIFAVMILFSVVCGIVSGKSAEVSDAAINSCVEAVELFLYLIGGMCMWGGLMKVAEKSHLTDKLAAAFRPFAKLIFKDLDLNGKAFHAICLNVTANMLGLGNAATPLGIEAMKALETEEKANGTATRNMIVFSVLNTASVRSKHGSAAPMEIFPCVIITSVIALAAGLISAIALDGISCTAHKRSERKSSGV